MNSKFRLPIGLRFILAMGVVYAVSLALCFGAMIFVTRHNSEFAAVSGALMREPGLKAVVIILLCSLLVVFFLIFAWAYDRWLMKPFRQFVATIDDVEGQDTFQGLPADQQEEWGTLGERLNRFIARLGDVQQQSYMVVQTSRLLALPVEMKTAVEDLLPDLLRRHQLSIALILTADAERTLRVGFSCGISSEFSRDWKIQFGEGLVGICFASMTARVVQDTALEERDPFVGELVRRFHVRSAVLLPMIIDGQCQGVAVYGSRDLNVFSPPQETMADNLRSNMRTTSLAAFTEHLALAVRNGQRMLVLRSENRRLLGENTVVADELLHVQGRLVRKVRELQTVYELALTTAASGSIADILRLVLAGVKDLADVQSAAFFSYDSSSERLEPMMPAFDRAEPDALAWSCRLEESPIFNEVVRTGHSQILNYVDIATQLPESWKWLGIRSILVLPLRQGQTVKGIFCALNKLNGLFTEDDLRLLSLLTGRITDVLHRVSVDEELKQRLQLANTKLEQSNTLKDELISKVSHELRTPLTTIKGFVSIVLDEETGSLTQQQRHFLYTADRAIDRLTLLVSDLLDISRIEAGHIKMQLQPTSLKEVFTRVVANFEPQFQAKGLWLKTAIAEALPAVLADSNRLMQVFDNFLANALTFTTVGGVTIAAIDKGDFVMVSVEDTGKGIEHSEQDKIFDKFYQTKVGGLGPAKGTGLGLAIVKSIIDSHRGKVWVESEVGQGSAFRFLLPRSRGDLETQRS